MNKFFCDIPIYWINLNNSVERRNSAMIQLKNYPNNLRIEAIDGRDNTFFFNNYIVKYPPTKMNFTNSLIAVICSHIKAIKTAYDNNLNHVCIFEDDFDLKLLEHYPHTLKNIIDKAPESCDIIQLYYYEIFKNAQGNIITEANIQNYMNHGLLLLKPNPCYSGTCYLINRKGMKEVLEKIVDTDGIKKFIFKVPITSPERILFHNLNYYVVNIPPILHCGHNSTLNSYFNGKKKNDLSYDQYLNGNRILQFLLTLKK